MNQICEQVRVRRSGEAYAWAQFKEVSELMGIHDQLVTLVASPSYPNSIMWSKENLIAVACGHVITIINPDSPVRPRGLITLPQSNLFRIGRIKKEEVLTPQLMPVALARDIRPCARSISWSPPGFSPNSGCLLAVCTIEGHVKIYRSPYCEYCAEWVEVVNISDILHNYLRSINFGEAKDLPAASSLKFANGQQNKKEKDALDLINTKQCASRIALLSSLIVAWSPTIKSADPIDQNISFSLLAMGGKSGNVSFWKISESRRYTIEHGRDNVVPTLIGIIQAHSSWVTAISWGIYATSSSKALVLATGSCDGSVKLWAGDVEDLIQSLKIENDIFSLIRVVTDVTSVPVSIISLMASSPLTNTVGLAIGRGSGSLEVFLCGMTSEVFENMGVYDAHKQAVTGLTWTADGCRLYSCSQDNSVRSWLLREKSLCEAPFPLNFPGIKNSLDLSAVSDLCFGIALSPGGLVAAVVRSFDSNLLNQMYEARTQKAAVEFYWTGAHSLEVPFDKQLNNCMNENSSLDEKNLVRWQSTIMWSLKHLESGDEPLVLWDNLMALLLFLKSSPLFVKHVLFKWFSSWSAGHSLKSLTNVQSIIPKLSTRKIHLLNIICRRLMLSESHESSEAESKREKAKSWNSLLANCEGEIQERFVAFTFKTVLLRASSSTGFSDVESWSPVGVAQMKGWVDTVKPGIIHDQLKHLLSEIVELKSRVHSFCEYEIEEKCGYCAAPVSFETAGVAKCEGIINQNGCRETHELERCAVSMKLCPITSPMWFCTCCERQVFNLPLLSFFAVSESALGIDSDYGSYTMKNRLIPRCIFCGILLQRLLPNFLLSASPV